MELSISSSGRCAFGGSRSGGIEVLFLALANGGRETSACQSSLPVHRAFQRRKAKHVGGGDVGDGFSKDSLRTGT